MEEIWKDVKNYEGFYEVSNLGAVRSLTRKTKTKAGSRIYKGKNLNPCFDGYGYALFGMCKNGKSKNKRGHVLVAEAFLNHKPDKFKIVVDHIDGDCKNNKIDNLQLISSRENTRKGFKNKTSKYVGVCWHKIHKKWIASIMINKKVTHLGYFTNEYDAHISYTNKYNETTKM